jgi:prepilin-type N-terminal cleavage/methylation domain-containing protein
VSQKTRKVLARRVLPPVCGFSLLELLITIAIIFILFTMYFSGGSKAFQAKKLKECEKNLQNIHIALRTYAQDNTDALPMSDAAKTSEAALSQLIPRYTTGSEFFICPGSSDKALPDARPFADRRISYAYYMGATLQDGSDAPLMSDRQVDTASKMAGQPVFSSNGKKPGNNHDKYGGNVLFSDGGVRSSPANAGFNLPVAPNVILLNPKP